MMIAIVIVLIIIIIGLLYTSWVPYMLVHKYQSRGGSSSNNIGWSVYIMTAKMHYMEALQRDVAKYWIQRQMEVQNRLQDKHQQIHSTTVVSGAALSASNTTIPDAPVQSEIKSSATAEPAPVVEKFRTNMSHMFGNQRA